MRIFGYLSTVVSRVESVDLPRARSNSSLLADIMLLTALALGAGAFRTFVRWHLQLPSHSALQWLPFVILGQLWVRRSWAGIYQGTLVGGICCFYPGRIMLSFGALAPFTEYVLAGGMVSWLVHILGKNCSWGWRIWLICPLMGLIANLSRWLYRLAYYLPFSQRALHHYNVLICAAFYVFFGICAGLLAAGLYTALRKRKKTVTIASNPI